MRSGGRELQGESRYPSLSPRGLSAGGKTDLGLRGHMSHPWGRGGWLWASPEEDGCVGPWKCGRAGLAPHGAQARVGLF